VLWNLGVGHVSHFATTKMAFYRSPLNGTIHVHFTHCCVQCLTCVCGHSADYLTNCTDGLHCVSYICTM
jgi:hypothetical protein